MDKLLPTSNKHHPKIGYLEDPNIPNPISSGVKIHYQRDMERQKKTVADLHDGL